MRILQEREQPWADRKYAFISPLYCHIAGTFLVILLPVGDFLVFFSPVLLFSALSAVRLADPFLFTGSGALSFPQPGFLFSRDVRRDLDS